MEVVFKAGYEVEANTKEDAVNKAIAELLNEIVFTGLGRFVIDVNREPYEEKVAIALSKHKGEKEIETEMTAEKQVEDSKPDEFKY